ncbi:MAG: hypothetical protein WD187_01695 [Candidatus Woykebacteria bacterium]
MADPAPDRDIEFLGPEFSSPKDIFRQIDPSVYKQLLIFLGISILLAAGFYIYLQISQNAQVNRETGRPQSQVQTTNKEAEEVIKQIFSRDQQRKNDVATINSALKSFFLDNKKAPETLDELVPEILAQLPTDPETSENYKYEPAADLTNWKISAILSKDKMFEVEGPR